MTVQSKIAQPNDDVDAILRPNPNRFVLMPIQYPDVWQAYKNAQALYWTAEELRLHQDIDDWEHKLTDDERRYIKYVLAFFAGADGIVNENIIDRFSSDVQIPEARCFYSMQQTIENIHCVTADTRILTDEGYRAIGDLVDTPVAVWNGAAFSRVTVRKTGTDQEFIKVVLSNGMELECTPGHKWLINGARVQTKDLTIGDALDVWEYPVVDNRDGRAIESPFTTGYVFGQGGRHGQRVFVPLNQVGIIPSLDFDVVERYADVYSVHVPSRYSANGDQVPINCNVTTRIEWMSGVIHSIAEFTQDAMILPCTVAETAKDMQLLLSTLGVFSNVSGSTVTVSSHGVAGLRRIGVVTPVCANVMTLPDPAVVDPASEAIHVVALVKCAHRGDSYCFNEPTHGTGCFAGIVTGQSESYSQMIDAYVKDDSEKRELFESLQRIPCIQRKGRWAQQWIESKSATFGERLVAMACVEGIHFSSSFAGIFWLKKRGLMPGLCQANQLISRDESSHADFAGLLFRKHLHKQRPSVERVHEIVLEAAEIEKDFVRDAIPVRLIGLNSDSMCQYVEYIADFLLSEILEVPKIYNASNPFPWMEAISLNSTTNQFERTETNYNFSNIDTRYELTEEF
ncbi:Ribonucleotide-diphosphate reductase (RNR), small subunit [Allomyces javanicus]|nr:Ribonucleotide-diphosphate reductase (RNR), small subunit [Allomyces javanicus]